MTRAKCRSQEVVRMKQKTVHASFVLLAKHEGLIPVDNRESSRIMKQGPANLFKSNS